MITKKITFYGKVQGVGFRYFSSKFAKKLKITGWVKNNEDGTVTLVAQGEEKNIEALINYLKLFFKGKIEKTEVQAKKQEIIFNNFTIEK